MVDHVEGGGSFIENKDHQNLESGGLNPSLSPQKKKNESIYRKVRGAE